MSAAAERSAIPAAARPADAGVRLRAAGLRPSRQRRILLRVLSEADRPLDSGDILDRARQHDPRISRSTVYRFLAALRRSGAGRPEATPATTVGEPIFARSPLGNG